MIWLIISILIIAADQLTKYFVAVNMAVGETAFSLGLFDITYVQNDGAAFSLFAGKMPLLSVISAAFCAAVIVYWIKKKPTQPLLCASLMMIFSGAFANAIDRIFRGFVVDFIRTTFINFPVFNVADIAITVGVGLLVLYELVYNIDKKKETSKGKSDIS